MLLGDRASPPEPVPVALRGAGAAGSTGGPLVNPGRAGGCFCPFFLPSFPPREIWLTGDPSTSCSTRVGVSGQDGWKFLPHLCRVAVPFLHRAQERRQLRFERGAAPHPRGSLTLSCLKSRYSCFESQSCPRLVWDAVISLQESWFPVCSQISWLVCSGESRGSNLGYCCPRIPPTLSSLGQDKLHSQVSSLKTCGVFCVGQTDLCQWLQLMYQTPPEKEAWVPRGRFCSRSGDPQQNPVGILLCLPRECQSEP